MIPSRVKIADLLKIPGFSNDDMIAIFDVFLRQCNPKTALEIGTYKGRTATHIASYSKIFFYVERDPANMKETKAHVDGVSTVIYSKPIQKVSGDVQLDEFERNKMDFIHIDGCHSFTAVLRDLELAQNILSENGIIVLDDCFSCAYPQITQATYAFLAKHSEFVLLFVGYNKGVICRREKYPEWHAFMVNEFDAELKQYYDKPEKVMYQLYKTSSVFDCETFGYHFNPNADKTKTIIGMEDSGGKVEDVVLR